MNDIKSFLCENEKNLQYNIEKLNSKEISEYYQNAKADAIHCYQFIKEHLDENKKILEVGGGVHLLTSFLNQKYDVTSVEPGGFTDYTNELRNKVLSKNNLKVHTNTLENFNTDERFDLIFSMNVLEHTNHIEQHIKSCINLLKDEKSILFIQCPNYTFPFEPHFYKWFIIFFLKFIFKIFKKKSLIKEFGKKNYENIFNNLNFDCTYFNIKKLNLPITFINPLKNIFDRLDSDSIFRKRIFKNKIVCIFYKIIKFFKIQRLFILLFPKCLIPYLIMEIKKNV